MPDFLPLFFQSLFISRKKRTWGGDDGEDKTEDGDGVPVHLIVG